MTPSRTAAVLRWAAYAGITAELATLPVRAVEVSGARLAAAWDPDALRFVVAGRFGDAALVRIGGLAFLAGATVRAGWARSRGLIGGLLIIASYALVGHPQATDLAYVLVPVQAIHLVAVSTWFGGLVFLAVELREQRRTGTARVGAGLVARFSTLATATVVLAAVTGVVLARSQLPTLAALRTSAYGRALLVKLAVLAVPLAIGGYNRQRLVPAIVRRADPAAWRHLGRTLVLEATFIALGVLLATAAMTSGGFR
jgi:putative copper export protein